jgi:DNA-binding response OmpR family regulator
LREIKNLIGFKPVQYNIITIKGLYEKHTSLSLPCCGNGRLNMANNIATIVIVDDSPSVRTLFELASTDSNINLEVFDSAQSSFEYLTDNKPALLFLNIKMPGKDGLTFLKELRHLPLHKDTPVVMISSKDYAQDRSVAEKLGALKFITKPMPIQVITDVIHKYIQPSQAT